ncbi:hypothetical protein JYU34_012209 [Plutella xylostella]|uniref:EF-hand domain-containing protein n=1 Tax=Plutella xylostella TaxID=51655 RepID=A0ABQ7QEL6_PLUXY|nr:hypothetical protein JYU34_012209 [Plutella xylostella]
MAISMMRIGFRSAALNLERSAAIISSTSVNSSQVKNSIHTKPQCNGSVCYLKEKPREQRDLMERPSEFWRRKMRTVHNILDVDKDGLISYNDFLLFAERFKNLGHLDEQHAQEFTQIIKLTWEEQWGAVDPYNFVTVEQYLEDMHHVLNDKSLKKKAHRWLPYLFKAVDKDASGFISVKEFQLFYECLGLDHEHAAVAFAVIDTNGDGKISLKEFVKLGKDFFFTEDETKVSKMFWGPLKE